MRIISLFSGCGGMDLGFEKANFKVVWANDNAASVWDTYAANFPNTYLEKRSLSRLPSEAIPSDIIGVIGGPPCQAWSNAGNGKGFEDKRGKLFFDFIRVIDDKKPLFFVAENVEGLLSRRNKFAFDKIKNLLENCGDGYELSIQVVD
ncbi:MAG: DNA cytosine methyltransferase, partial [Mucilaginibacter sp.]